MLTALVVGLPLKICGLAVCITTVKSGTQIKNRAPVFLLGLLTKALDFNERNIYSLFCGYQGCLTFLRTAGDLK